MALADPHCHTTSSDGMAKPQELVAAALKAGLDLIVVTDHDTMASVQETQRRGEEAGLTVVAGQEITTRWPAQTHLMGWFLDGPVRSGMTLADTVAAIRDRGGLAIIPHPFMPFFFASVQPKMLRDLIETTSVDGIEVVFTAPLGARRRRLLEEFYAANGDRLGAPIGASDCHFGGFDLGSVVTRYEGDFRSAVERRATEPLRRRAAAIPTRVAVRQQWRSLVELPLRRLRGQL